jgi:hypothetical protein
MGVAGVRGVVGEGQRAKTKWDKLGSVPSKPQSLGCLVCFCVLAYVSPLAPGFIIRMRM